MHVSGASATGSVASHPLLDGVVDNDTLAASPTQGALIVGNATPLWAAYPASGIQYHVLELPDASGVTPTWGFLDGNNFGTFVANLVFATSTVPGIAAPTFRALVTADLANSLVTYAKIQNVTDNRLLGNATGGAAAPSELSIVAPLSLSASTLTTSMNTARMIGRTTAGTGVMEEISIGTGLSLAAGTLSASGVTSPWDKTGAVVHLVTSTDNVTVGSTTAGGKVFVDGDADEIQFQVQANATQTANMAVFEDSAGTDVVIIGPPVLPGNSTSVNNLSVTSTFPLSSVTAALYGVSFIFTKNGSSSTGSVECLHCEMNGTYSGSNVTNTVTANNTTAGTAASMFQLFGNHGVRATSTGTTAGYNVGVAGQASGGNVNAGISGVAITNKASALNVGVFGIGRNTAGSPSNYGGLFELGTSDVLLTGAAALGATNGTATDDIVRFLDNTSLTWSLADGGAIAHTPVGTAAAAYTMTAPASYTGRAFAIFNSSPTLRTKLDPFVANSGSNTAYTFDTNNSLTGSTILLSVLNAGTEQTRITNAGLVKTLGAGRYAAVADVNPTAMFGGNNKTNTTAVGNVLTGIDDLITYSLPAATLATNGDRVEITAWGTTAANANLKEIRLLFGATVLFTTGAVAQNGTAWRIKASVVRTGATTQISIAAFSGSALVTTTAFTASPAETLSGAVTIKCTGEATATDDIIQTGLTVDYYPLGA